MHRNLNVKGEDDVIEALTYWFSKNMSVLEE
jgi:hypothetical protein